MAEYFYAKNDDGSYSVDDTLTNYALYSSNLLSSYYIGSSSAIISGENYALYSIPLGSNDVVTFESTNGASSSLGIYTCIHNSRCLVQTFVLNNPGGSPANYGQYVMVRVFRQSNVVSSSGNYGIEVRNSSGNLVFSSTQKILNGDSYMYQTTYNRMTQDDDANSIFPEIDYNYSHNIAIAIQCPLLIYFDGGYASFDEQLVRVVRLNSPMSISLINHFMSFTAFHRNNGSYPLLPYGIKTTNAFITNVANF